MDPTAALRLAINLVQVPSRVRLARGLPLPDGIELLLRVAAGEPEAQRSAAEFIDRPPELIREAATFFVEQILMAPGADSYRVLGAEPDAPLPDLRRNMALLVRLLHPDVSDDDPRALFAQRINKAWEDLKTPDRRKAYDAERARLMPSDKRPAKREPRRLAARRNATARSDVAGAGAMPEKLDHDRSPGTLAQARHRFMRFIGRRP